MTHSENGFFNEFGGKYVAEVLRRPLDELEVAFKEGEVPITKEEMTFNVMPKKEGSWKILNI